MKINVAVPIPSELHLCSWATPTFQYYSRTLVFTQYCSLAVPRHAELMMTTIIAVPGLSTGQLLQLCNVCKKTTSHGHAVKSMQGTSRRRIMMVGERFIVQDPQRPLRHASGRQLIVPTPPHWQRHAHVIPLQRWACS